LGANGGSGGFGAGGGGGATAGSGGTYGGAGGAGMGAAGGGGAALGGAIFVREGGTLILDAVALEGNFAVTGGSTTGEGGATGGDAAGTVMFLEAGSSTSIGVAAGKSHNIEIADAIAGDGGLTKAGSGTLAIWAENSYSGGTQLDGGTLHLVAKHAAGTGAITFGAGSQILALSNSFESLPSGAYGFANQIVSFGKGDILDLENVLAEGARVLYAPETGILRVFSLGETFTFTVLKPTSIDFRVEADSSGDAQIVLGDGVTIVGTGNGDVIDAGHTVMGQPLPTEHADWIDGRGGKDKIAGRGGNDWLQGGKGDDHLSGGKGDDRLEGGDGSNVLKGGGGSDTFALKPGLEVGGRADGHVWIKDFDIDRDLIELDGEVFAVLGPALDPSEFRLGRTAKDADDHILYDTNSGRVRFDADGQGGADAVRIARLDKHLDLDEGHFLVA
jgi:autotransporter-associated beta strand protein